MDFTKNHFELLGLPTDFIIDLGALSDRYRQLQKVVHPDRFVNASDLEKRQSIQHSVQINEAYQTLKNPITRAQYLLSLRGVELDAQKETTCDTLFLMEQMELREKLEQIPNQPDAENALAEMLQKVSGLIKSHIAKMAVSFESHDKKSIEETCEMIRKLQFLNKLYFEIETVEEQLEEQL